MIKVLIADDQELIRQSLEIVLGVEKDMEVIGTASNGTEVIRIIRENKPDVVLMDVRMPGMDGVTCTKIIKDNHPEIKVIILTTFDDDEYVYNGLRDGANGYLLKGNSMQELVSAIRKVYNGGTIINEEVTSKVVSLFSKMAKHNQVMDVPKECTNEITKSEWKIVQLIGNGLSNKEIASKLSLSEGTIRNQLSTILRKLDLRDRTQLAIWAVQSGKSQEKVVGHND